MITTTTSTIPNTEITEIISVLHNRVVLGTNLFSDISAGFSDIFGGKNTAYEKRLADITNDVIEGLKKKASKIKADALIDLKVDVDEISGGNKSMFMVTAIATAVRLGKHVYNGDGKSIEEIELEIIKSKILKSIDDNTFNPASNWTVSYLISQELPEAFEAYLLWITTSRVLPDNWEEAYTAYISNLNSKDLFDKTISYFSKENRTENENASLKVIFQHVVIDYFKIIEILNSDKGIETKRLCLNLLYHYNKSYTKSDFELVERSLTKVRDVFPKTSTEEIGTGLLSKGELYWRCICGNKNYATANKYCSRCNLDEFGNKAQTRNVADVIVRLEELLISYK